MKKKRYRDREPAPHSSADATEFEIRFRNQAYNELRKRLLSDLGKEYYACLLAKRRLIKDLCVYTVVDVIYPDIESYKSQGVTALRVDGAFMREILLDVERRIDVDSVIDVHTHPFSMSDAWFSGIDDRDEGSFREYLHKEDPAIYYASVVLTQASYSARSWEIRGKNEPVCYPALIRTQKAGESGALHNHDSCKEEKPVGENGMFSRSVLALGLDSMRLIADRQRVTVAGLGGIGSIIAEHLVHMGFTEINLIDFDNLEVSNLNRVVGATYEDAVNNRLKVEAIKEHLQKINPDATVNAYPNDVFHEDMEYVLASSHWVFAATDNHSSRYRIQQLCFKYYVPFITAGVNITVTEGNITDMSGEVILVRIGDRVCLSCLKRINFNEVAKDIHPDALVREGLVEKGYVSGKDVKEPAVKTLNTYLATMAVDTLVNQYTERRRDAAVMVYEDNGFPAIYEDTFSVSSRNLKCSVCGI